MSNIPKYSVIQYVRKKRTPFGVIVAIKSDYSQTGFDIGYSLCNKKDRFTKRRALEIALGRADIGTFEYPQEIKKMMPRFIERCKKYYYKNKV